MDNTPLLMNLLQYIIVWTICLCFIPRKYKQEIYDLALIGSTAILILVVQVWYYFDLRQSGFQFISHIPLLPNYNISLSLGWDGMSVSFVLLTTFIMPLCILASENIYYRYKQFIIYLFFLELFLWLSFSVTNLFFFYIFFESVLIPMFIMIGVWGNRQRKISAAYYFFLYTLFGSFFLLFGILYLYLLLGDLEYSVLLNKLLSADEQIFLWWFFFIPFAIKIPMFPCHIWLPEAHVEAPTIGSVILASLLLKLGGYGFLRFTLPIFPLATFHFNSYLYILGLLSVIYASFVTIRQNDMKRIIAYSSIAHMNLIVLGLFSFSLQGITGAVYLMIAHGIVSSALFFCVGVLYDRYHTRSLRHYSGLTQVMPLFTAFFFVFTLANMSFPGTSNFVGEILIFIGIYQQNQFIMILSSLSIVLSAVYAIWLFNRLAFGTLKNGIEIVFSYADINRNEFYILSTLTIVMLFLGIYSWPLTDLVHLSSKHILWVQFWKI